MGAVADGVVGYDPATGQQLTGLERGGRIANGVAQGAGIAAGAAGIARGAVGAAGLADDAATVGRGATGSDALAAREAADLSKAGRAGKQARLRELVDDPNASAADRGWIRQELNSIDRNQRSSIRVPPGKNLAHRRGFEAKKGYGYEYSDLQDIYLHKLQHKHEGY